MLVLPYFCARTGTGTGTVPLAAFGVLLHACSYQHASAHKLGSISRTKGSVLMFDAYKLQVKGLPKLSRCPCHDSAGGALQCS